MQRATIHERSFGNEGEAHLPYPSHETEDEEHHDQIDQRIAAIGADGAGFAEPERHRRRSQTTRIDSAVQNLPAGIDLVQLLAILLILGHRPRMQDTHAQPFGQEPDETVRLVHRNKIAGQLLHRFGNITIRGMQCLSGGLAVQVFVAEQLASLQSRILGQSAHMHVIFDEKRRVIAVGIEDAAQAEREQIEQPPAKERQVGHETLPLVTLHHAPGQADGLPCPDIRIFGDDVGHHTVGIRFDERADDGERPQEQEHVLEQHHLRHRQPFARGDRVEETAHGKFVVGPPLKQHAHHDHPVCLLDEQPYEKVNGQGYDDWYGHGDAVIMHDGIGRIGHRQNDRTR